MNIIRVRRPGYLQDIQDEMNRILQDAFAGSIANSTVLRSYDNLSIVDFEMIVATNDSDGDGDPDGDTTYYFYLQIT